MPKIKKGSNVRHCSGWTAKVAGINGKLLGNRVIYVKRTPASDPVPFLECVFTLVENP